MEKRPLKAGIVALGFRPGTGPATYFASLKEALGNEHLLCRLDGPCSQELDLVHVVDASHPQMEEQIASARQVLAELDCSSKPTVMAFNKCDLVGDRVRLSERAAREEQGIVMSAATGEGADELLRLVGERLEQALVPVDVVLPWDAQSLLPEVHERGRVLSEEFNQDGVALMARVPHDLSQRLQRAAGVEAVEAGEE